MDWLNKEDQILTLVHEFTAFRPAASVLVPFRVTPFLIPGSKLLQDILKVSELILLATPPNTLATPLATPTWVALLEML